MHNRRNSFLTNILLAFLCVILFLVLGGFLVGNHLAQAKTSDQLKAVNEDQKSDEENTGEESQETTEDAQEETSQETAAEAQTEALEGQEETPQETAAKGISCWGDEFYTGEEASQYSYRSVLQRLLTDNGYDYTVADKTLVGASTLSVMKMAGVPQTDLDAYIAAHQQAAAGAQLPVTETGIRDLTPEQTDRSDKDYIPVLFMGHYGGWNHDPQELIQQQQKVLDTFGANKDKFVIIGLVPQDGSVDLATYDNAMWEAWGDHYISSAEITQHSQGTHEGQAEIANALYQKLIDLNYISKAE